MKTVEHAPVSLHFLEDNALGMRRTSERLLPLITQVRLLVGLVSPQLRPTVVLELTPSSHTARLPARTEPKTPIKHISASTRIPNNQTAGSARRVSNRLCRSLRTPNEMRKKRTPWREGRGGGAGGVSGVQEREGGVAREETRGCARGGDEGSDRQKNRL